MRSNIFENVEMESNYFVNKDQKIDRKTKFRWQDRWNRFFLACRSQNCVRPTIGSKNIKTKISISKFSLIKSTIRIKKKLILGCWILRSKTIWIKSLSELIRLVWKLCFISRLDLWDAIFKHKLKIMRCMTEIQ